MLEGNIRGEQLAGARRNRAVQSMNDLATYESVRYRSVGKWNDLPINRLKLNFACMQNRHKLFDGNWVRPRPRQIHRKLAVIG